MMDEQRASCVLIIDDILYTLNIVFDYFGDLCIT